MPSRMPTLSLPCKPPKRSSSNVAAKHRNIDSKNAAAPLNSSAVAAKMNGGTIAAPQNNVK